MLSPILVLYLIKKNELKSPIQILRQANTKRQKKAGVVMPKKSSHGICIDYSTILVYIKLYIDLLDKKKCKDMQCLQSLIVIRSKFFPITTTDGRYKAIYLPLKYICLNGTIH